MGKTSDYTVSLEETLKRQTVECLREASRTLFRIPKAKDMERDVLADRIIDLFAPDPRRWLEDELQRMDEETADVVRHMLLDGPQRLSSDDPVHVRVMKILRSSYWVDCRDWKDGKEAVSYTFAVPEEVRCLFSSEDDFDRFRDLGSEILDYVICAVTLYGIVSFEELQGLIKRYLPAGGFECGGNAAGIPEDLEYIKSVVKGRAPAEAHNYLIYGGWICHPEFGSAKSEHDEIIEDFLCSRNVHKRWYPADREEFLSFGGGCFFLDIPECGPLEKFLESHGMNDEDGRVAALYDAVCQLQLGESDIGIMGSVLEKLDPEKDPDLDKFGSLWAAFANRVNRRILNGASPDWVSSHVRSSDLPPIIKIAPGAAVGRNDPCPCGSGKKFKKCCGMKSSKAAAVHALADERLGAYRPMREAVDRFVERHVTPMSGMKELSAAAERLGITKDGVPTGELNPEVHAAVIGDFASMMDDEFGPPPIRRLLGKASKFKGDDAKALEMLRQYRYTWLEVLDAEPGVGVACRDLLTGEEGFLMETAFSRDEGIRGMTVCAGVGKLPNGTWMILGTMHPCAFENPSVILKIVLSHLSIPSELPVVLSLADQARFAAETVKRLNANGRFGNVEYGCLQ